MTRQNITCQSTGGYKPASCDSALWRHRSTPELRIETLNCKIVLKK